MPRKSSQSLTSLMSYRALFYNSYLCKNVSYRKGAIVHALELGIT